MNYQYQKAIAVLVLIAIVVGAVAIIALIVNTFVCNNCLLGGGQAQLQTTRVPAANSGIAPMKKIDERPVSSSFDEAKSTIGEIPGLAIDSKGHYQVSYVQGQNLDENGQAERWLFEVKTNQGKELRVFDRNGWTVIPWAVDNSMEEIKIDEIKSPSLLFSENRQLILQNGSASSAVREIELRGNVYTLTIKSPDAAAVMVFDATTGALIE